MEKSYIFKNKEIEKSLMQNDWIESFNVKKNIQILLK